MSYVQNNLNKNEELILESKKAGICLLGVWLKGILLCWLLFIPTIKAIIKTIAFKKATIGLTNKRLVGRVGIINTVSLDCPIEKVQNVNVQSGFFGKIFKYGTVEIVTAGNSFFVMGVKNVESFKSAIMNQIEVAKEEERKANAAEMAKAMASAMGK